MNYGESLLSKVLDQNDVTALKRYTLDESHFPTAGERSAYRFIRDYAEQNAGQAPDYRRVVAEISEFTYVAGVEDSYEYLTKQLKDRAAKRQFVEWINDAATEKALNDGDWENFVNVLISEAERITIDNTNRRSIGTDIKANADKFLAEYEKRKRGESLKIWRSHFPTINAEIGGYASSNIYTWFGRSGRGKSVIALEEAIESAVQGANVLIWAMEMGWYEVLTRIYVSLSGREGLITSEVDGVAERVGFDAKEVRHGNLSEEFEAGLRTFLVMVNDIIDGNIIVRAVDDDDFIRRSLRELDADIIATNADVVLIDPFYYMDYEKNTSKTAGGDAAETSKKLRRLAGKTQTVIHAITQADEVKDDQDDEGNRELKLPRRAEVKKTKALLEDAANLIAIDTLNDEGRGIVGLQKGRNGGEGTEVEIVYLPGYGVVREMKTGEVVAAQFEGEF